MAKSILLYFPNNPAGLFEFLDAEKAAKKASSEEDRELLLWVDNNDHQTSSEFYRLRKYVRQGLPVNVHINPAKETPAAVYGELTQLATFPVEIANKEHE